MPPIPPRANLSSKCADSILYKDQRYIVCVFAFTVFIF